MKVIVVHQPCIMIIDLMLNLDNLLIQIRHEVTPKWYQFGLAVGINKETLEELSNLTPEECIIEISDIWLKTSATAITWRDVADTLKETGYHRLAEKILNVYKTGETLELDQYNKCLYGFVLLDSILLQACSVDLEPGWGCMRIMQEDIIYKLSVFLKTV